jgi:hypothetical protein
MRTPKPLAMLLLALTMSSGLLLARGSPAAAAMILVVDDDGLATAADCNALTPTYMTISAAEAAATPGDTIKVCPGLYAEQVSIDVPNLTVLGAQAGVDARSRLFVPANESVIDHPCGPVQLRADNIVLDGFTVQGATLSDPCFIAGIWTNPGSTGTNGGFRILNNIVQNNISGIELDSNCVNATLVRFNLIQNNSNPGPGSGNAIQTNFGLCNAEIDRNEFRGHTNSSVLMVATQSDIRITNNNLATPRERIVLANTSDSLINGNVSLGSTQLNGTIRLFGGNSNVGIDSNTLVNGVQAIRLDNIGPGPNSGVSAHLNCIDGNSIAGLHVDASAHSGTVMAQNNWWGSSTGPTHPSNPGGTGDAIIDPDLNVDYTPFLTSPPAVLTLCPVPPPPPNTPGKVTGGGKIEPGPTTTSLDVVLDLATVLIDNGSGPASVGSKATFGLSVVCCPPKGNLEYNDHDADIRIKATSVDTLVITSPSTACPTGKHAQFKGNAKQNGTNVTYTVDVDDCGQPGSGLPDRFRIETTGGYGAEGPLIGGNITIH